MPDSIMISTYQPVNPAAPRYQLASRPQLAEAISKEDDWTGTKDAAARRRAQTRLITRAYRERKALAENKTPVKSEELVECWDIKQQSISVVPASRIKELYNARGALLPDKQRKAQFNIIFPLCPDHLITLLQLNALRALAVNRTLISGILVTPLDCGEEIIHIIPYPTKPELLPLSLLPTALQQTVPQAARRLDRHVPVSRGAGPVNPGRWHLR
ncbi:hypothetical protein GMDG_02973 [Pseudogymnoascus destructans 20631-21]|uniref:Uncharacterized protein n=1 Tax=Pseudogymnoascus destructans (strain ATCC MYA-4855 / 20631-21) TaxID=658429 RepID=L8G829_PSED2|nr:hypothetical protein GMDG_02973 [Pseudogymnoascus destructans 20631-21]